MLPLYKRTVRFLSDPYRRMKKPALLALLAALVLLYVVLVGLSGDTRDVVIRDRPGFQAPTANALHPGVNNRAFALEKNRQRPVLRRDDGEDEEEEPAGPPMPEHVVAATVQAKRPVEGAGEQDHDTKLGVDQPEKKLPASQLPYFVRMVLPLLAGFAFGFLGSVPIAGPTSAMVLKLGIQGKYQAALTIAFGGAISEATYAGIAFWGFGSFLAGAKFLLPVSKVLGAIMFTIVGLIFLKSEVKSPLDVDANSASHKGMRARPPRDEVLRNVLMGVTMSGINPALLATYTGAIASVYGTGLLEFTLFLAFVFGIGVCCGVSTWFFILLSLLQKYKQRLKKQTIGYIMRGMGCFLLTLGVFCAKSSFEYFVWGLPETASTTP